MPETSNGPEKSRATKKPSDGVEIFEQVNGWWRILGTACTWCTSVTSTLIRSVKECFSQSKRTGLSVNNLPCRQCTGAFELSSSSVRQCRHLVVVNVNVNGHLSTIYGTIV